MLHTLVLRIIHLGWLALPFPLYYLYNKNFLQLRQALLLVIQAVILVSLMLPGWLMQAVRLVANGCFVFVTLDLCIIEYEQFASRYEITVEGEERRTKNYQLIKNQPIFFINYFHTLKKFKIKETLVLVLVLLFWIVIRIMFTKATSFGIETELDDGSVFEGFLVTLDGWNCNYIEYTVVSGVCFLVLLFSCWFVQSILKSGKLDTSVSQEEYQDLNSYKIYLLLYLILPALFVFLIDFLYNLISHVQCAGLLDCYRYFKYGIIFHLIINWGIAICIGYFFHKKSGRFTIQSELDKSQKSVEMNDDNLELPLKSY